MGPAQKESALDLQSRLTKLLRDLLKPVRVKSLVITRSEGSTVYGVVVTVCPVEKTESGRDFEAGLEGNKRGSVRYVSVDGRRLLPKRTRAKASVFNRGRDPIKPPASG